MTKQEIRDLSNEALVEIFGLTCEQKAYREELVKINAEAYQSRLDEALEEIELMRAELERRLKRCISL